uniref:Uncharacterized protein n=1 Tax=Percolomonas cosmopolitus TaxID=63605 RepID=A0A6U0K269_9EUKA
MSSSSPPPAGNTSLIVPNSAYSSSNEDSSPQPHHHHHHSSSKPKTFHVNREDAAAAAADHDDNLSHFSDTNTATTQLDDSTFQLAGLPPSKRRNTFLDRAPFTIPFLSSSPKYRTRSAQISFILQQIKCVCITFIVFVFLIGMFLLCYVIWARKHKCIAHEQTLASFIDVQFGMKAMDEFWPKDPDALGSTYPQQKDKVINHFHTIRRNMNQIYMRQKWSGNLLEYQTIKDDNQCGGVRRQLYELFGGPWNVLTGKKDFENDQSIPDKKPLGAAFYPQDMTKTEFNSWVDSLTVSQKEAAVGFYHTVERDASTGGLKTRPYSDVYKEELNEIRQALLKLADLFINVPPLRELFLKKEEAFRTNSHTAADLTWLDLNPALEVDVTIGFYETYEDELFGYKATCEAYLSVKDSSASSQLQSISSHLQFIEDSLPIDDQYKNPNVGSHLNPISVVNMILNAGDAAAGVQTAAYNLPNDATILHDKGSKRIMLKNVQEAKFTHTLVPLTSHVLSADQHMFVAFDGFFTHILSHELMHGLGPHTIQVGGTNTSVRAALQEFYSPLEECKADVSGLYMLTQLINHQKMNFVFDFSSELLKQTGITYAEKLRRSLYVTYLVSIFRSARFGTEEAHGKAVTIAFNYLHDNGGIVSTTIGTKAGEGEAEEMDIYKHAINFSFMGSAVIKLMGEILTIQAHGDYLGAKAFVEHYGKPSSVMSSTLEMIAEDHSIPIDIRPVYGDDME